MARHSFIQMSKLSNVKGRISYISDPKRQEYLYATFSTREDMTFWNDLAKECQEEFKRFGTEGKCIEARELIIALPEEYTKFDPNQVLREFTEQFKKRYDVECVSALHHNKTKKNYHKTEKYTAGSPCGAYIGTPFKFEACRASIYTEGMFLCCLTDKKL